jgi:proline dehydrogenase
VVAVRARPLPGLLRVLEGRTGGPGHDDAAALAGRLTTAGLLAGLQRVPADEGATTALAGRLRGTAAAPACELTVIAGEPGAERLTRAILDAGLDAVLDGPASAVLPFVDALPGVRVVVHAGATGAEERCRELAGGRVRLVRSRGAGADVAFVRCLNVLMSGTGYPAVAVTDPRLVAIAGERAAWFDRPSDSWEYAMPYGVRTDEQGRLTAAGYRVRALAPWGPGAATAVARRLVTRA